MTDSEELYEAIERLRKSIDDHRAVQEEANAIMRGLIGKLGETAQEMEELKDELAKSHDP